MPSEATLPPFVSRTQLMPHSIKLLQVLSNLRRSMIGIASAS
jgi:hypothetical protein